MREIKFRAWDGLRMTLCGISFNNSNGWLEIPSRSILMQFTGLSDKNGKEIWEGDIITGLIGQSHQVSWDEDKCAFVLRKPFDGCLPDKCSAAKFWEVIGNIYENPELLEGGVK